jgi:meiotically up-regulated gene 157 (Mug157) protein
MAVVLQQLADMPAEIAVSNNLRERARNLSQDIRRGIQDFGLIRDGTTTRYAYEVDGFGNQLSMDDANVPSLLSLPYLGWCDTDDSVYQATRSWILSTNNPQFVVGDYATGIGSPHTPDGHVWPIAMAITALTSTNESDLLTTLEVLETTDAGTGAMHESFHVNDPHIFTRSWFSWADMTYVHLVLRSVGLAFD